MPIHYPNNIQFKINTQSHEKDKQPEWMKNLKEDDNPVLLMIK